MPRRYIRCHALCHSKVGASPAQRKLLHSCSGLEGTAALRDDGTIALLLHTEANRLPEIRATPVEE